MEVYLYLFDVLFSPRTETRGTLGVSVAVRSVREVNESGDEEVTGTEAGTVTGRRSPGHALSRPPEGAAAGGSGNGPARRAGPKSELVKLVMQS